MAEAIYNAAHAGAAEAGGFVARLRKSIADYRVYRATVEELAQLSDRELTDLGIHRTSIRDIARSSVYGD